MSFGQGYCDALHLVRRCILQTVVRLLVVLVEPEFIMRM